MDSRPANQLEIDNRRHSNKGIYITGSNILIVRHIGLTAAAIENILYLVAWTSLPIVLGTYAAAAYCQIDQPPYPVKLDTLFTASATIMGLAAFGSALSTLGRNTALIKGIAYTLVPLIVVQAVFMLSILDRIGFPVSLWIVITAVLLMLLVLAIVANRIKTDGTDGSTQ